MAKRTYTRADPAAKAAALRLLARGLISQAEAADLAGVSRMQVSHWAREIDVAAARTAVVLKLWKRPINRSPGP